MMRLIIVLCFIPIFFSRCANSEQAKPVQQTGSESRYSPGVYQSIQAVMEGYYPLTEAFVNWDSVKVSLLAADLDSKLNRLQLAELKKDSSIALKVDSLLVHSKKDLEIIGTATGITGKRHALNSLSDHLFQVLNTVQYNRQTLYLQECPMAFNDSESGVWLSKEAAIRNPYMGVHHPYYKGSMVTCGETKEIVNFTGSR
jgi:hypothetical protein